MDFAYGDIEAQWPEGYYPPEAWPEYGNVADPQAVCTREKVGSTECCGMRWSLWPLTFEEYVSDQEPDLRASDNGTLARNRLIMWHRLRRTDIPTGWHALSAKPWRIDGVIALSPNEDYTQHWHKNARRDLRLWHETRGYTITPLPYAEFAAAYKRSLIAKRVNLDRLYQLERRFDTAAKDHIELWGVRNQAGEVVAGTAIVYSPTYQQSTHLSPFITAEGREVYAATALMDHWFKETMRRGYRFATSTNFWYPGQPKGWKGFSEFKSHFGFKFVAHPPTLFRLRGGKIF